MLNVSNTLTPPIPDHHVAVNIAYYFMGAIGMLLVCSAFFFVGLRKTGFCYTCCRWLGLKMWQICCCCCANTRHSDRLKQRAEELHDLITASASDVEGEGDDEFQF